MAKHSI